MTIKACVNVFYFFALVILVLFGVYIIGSSCNVLGGEEQIAAFPLPARFCSHVQASNCLTVSDIFRPYADKAIMTPSTFARIRELLGRCTR